MIWRQKEPDANHGDNRLLNLISLTSIAVAHPLQEQLARNPEFFVVKHSEPVDIFSLVLLLSVAIPLVLFALLHLSGVILPRAKRNTYYALLFMLTVIAASTALNRISYLPVPVHFLAAGALAWLVVYGYRKYDSIRSSFPYLAIAILLVPAVFLTRPSIRKLISPPRPVSFTMPKIKMSPPIIMIIWDEFPLVSLLDRHNEIDGRFYPNLSDFSKKSYWFRNASTVSGWTHPAVTSILTGMYPRAEALPTYYDYPQNLFTMLEDAYGFKVFERETRLCPMELCSETWTKPSYAQRMRETVEDLSALFLHIALPLRMDDYLPSISNGWEDFWNEKQNRVQEFQSFLDSVEPKEKPTFFFLHSGLPHSPWTNVPSGETQTHLDDSLLKGTSQISTGALHDFKSHILQVSYVDQLIGKLIEKLHRNGLYDECLIIITADHGICMNAGSPERDVTDQTYQDIMMIPLFIKVPHQQVGRAIDRNVETIDIVPTIAEVLDTNAFWAEGMSGLDFSKPERNKKVIYSGGIKTFEARPALNHTLKRELLP